MNSKALTVGQRVNNIRDLMVANKEKMFAALPLHITPEKMIRIACSSLVKNPKLLECTQSSLVAAITEAASLGLVPDGVLGHGYLVPFKTTCTFIPGYRGLVQLCRQSGAITSFYAHVVRPYDDFQFTLGTAKAIVHNPSDEPHDDTYTHAYAVAHYQAGGFDFEVMTHSDIQAHKVKYSKGYTKSDSPWNTAPEAMAKKTVVRQLIKMLPVSSEIQRLAARDDDFGGMTFDGTVKSKRVTRVELDFGTDAGEEPTTEPQAEAEQAEADVPPGTEADMFSGQTGNQP